MMRDPIGAYTTGILHPDYTNIAHYCQFCCDIVIPEPTAAIMIIVA